MKGAVAKWSGECLDVKKARDWDAAILTTVCSKYQGSVGECGVDKKAELETLI